MTNSPIGLLVVSVYLGAVALSLPAAAAVLLLSRRLGVRRAAAGVALASAVLVGIASIAVATVVGPRTGDTVAGLGAVALLGLWIAPVLLGRWVVARLVGLADEPAAGFAVAGLPVALLASAVWLVVTGAPIHYDLTFRSGPALWTASAVFLAAVALGPGLAGAGLHRLAGRRR